MAYNKKTSLLVPSQLPEFIRDDVNYSNFVLFLKAYYEWMEQQGGALYESKKIPDDYDIDTTMDSFLQYYINEFLTFFPQGSLVDQRKLIKISKDIYRTKGTPASYEFLFRVLYNTDLQLYNSKDYVLKPSDGKWLVTKSLNLTSGKGVWAGTEGYKVFGETSFAYAVIEKVNFGIDSTSIVVSSVDRPFISGETIRVVDSFGNNVLFSGNTVTAKIAGTLSSVSIDPLYTGAAYAVGDPVVFYGGLDPTVNNAVGASATVGTVSGSSINSVRVLYGGSGYRISNTDIIIDDVSGENAVLAVSSLNANSVVALWVCNDTIQDDTNAPNRQNIRLNQTFTFPNVGTTTANVALNQILTFPNLTTAGMANLSILSPGFNYTSPSANAFGTYTAADNVKHQFKNLGILAPIIIDVGGVGYVVGDKIDFINGNGFGANAYISSVSGTGSITGVSYRYANTAAVLPLGGLGYTQIPTPVANSTTGTGATLRIPGNFGADGVLSTTLSIFGQVQSIAISNYGTNYVTRPSASLRVADILAYNYDINTPLLPGDKIIQTNNDNISGNTIFLAYVDSVTLYQTNTNPLYSNYNIRLYEYSSDVVNTTANLIVLRSNNLIGANLKLSLSNTGIYTLGKKIYGNGLARPVVNFSQGLQYGQGHYLNSDGQPSGSSILQNDDFNEYTYFLKVQKALEEYKNTALSFLHPSGLHYKTFNKLDNTTYIDTDIDSQELNYNPLSTLLGLSNFTANIANTNFSNTIIFTNLSGANVANVITPNSYITIYPPTGTSFASKVVRVVGNNTIVMQDNWITSVPNVAIGRATNGTNSINITSTTNTWSIATGDTVVYPSDYIKIGSIVTFNGNTSNVTQITQSSRYPTINVFNTILTSANGANGYITVTRNVATSNIWVTSNVTTFEVIELWTENNNILTTEDGLTLILG